MISRELENAMMIYRERLGADSYRPADEAVLMVIKECIGAEAGAIKMLESDPLKTREEFKVRVGGSNLTKDPVANRRILSRDWVSDQPMTTLQESALKGYLASSPTLFVVRYDMLIGMTYMHGRLATADLDEKKLHQTASDLVKMQQEMERVKDEDEEQLTTVNEFLRLHNEKQVHTLFLEEDPSGLVLLDESLKALQGKPSRYNIPSGIPSWAIHSLVHFGADQYKRIYYAVYPYTVFLKTEAS